MKKLNFMLRKFVYWKIIICVINLVFSLKFDEIIDYELINKL